MTRAGAIVATCFLLLPAPGAEAGGAPRLAPPAVVSAGRRDLSPPLRDIPETPVAASEEPALNLVLPNRWKAVVDEVSSEPVCYAPEVLLDSGPMPSPIASFEGVSNRNGRFPSDANADVGLGHVMQWVNLSLAVWDKAGTLLYGPVNGNTLWYGFGGICEANNNGDPIVLYDPLANRWLASQLAFDWPQNFHQCVAVSATEDPTGPWYRYDFPYSATTLNDYPKLAVWPDAYYMTANQFDGETQEWRGQGVVALERERMLEGGEARMVRFDLYAVDPAFGGQLPADFDGPVPPPEGAPAYFAEIDDDAWGWESDRLQIWEFRVDWTDPALSTFGEAGFPNAVVDLTAAGFPFDSNLCNYSVACIPQPSGNRLDALADRLMWRLAYRNFGAHEALLASHTVDVDGSDHAGVRWYEIRDPGGSPFVAQAGTHAPDSDHRWMGSAAMDGAGDVALGYSVSSGTTCPSIRYAGRTASDPPGTLPRTETELLQGTGTQSWTSRWGDYSSMSVDPADDCTFWYTQQYYAALNSTAWKTRIGSFRFPECGSCPLLGRPFLAVAREAPTTLLSWTEAENAAAYDVIRGDLDVLRSGGGDFGPAVLGCPAADVVATTLELVEEDPGAGSAFWYLVRATALGCLGTLADEGTVAGGARDAGVAASAQTCP